MSSENPETPDPHDLDDAIPDEGSVSEWLKEARENPPKGKGQKFNQKLMRQRFHTAPVPPRLTVLTQVYHQRPGKQPIRVEGRSQVSLVSSEQAYVRELTFRKDWTALEYGWVSDPCALVLAPEKATPLGNPTPEQKAAEEEKVLEVGIFLPSLDEGVEPSVVLATYVALGDVLPLNVADGVSYAARCVSGEVRCVLTVFPK